MSRDQSSGPLRGLMPSYRGQQAAEEPLRSATHPHYDPAVCSEESGPTTLLVVVDEPQLLQLMVQDCLAVDLAAASGMAERG